MSQSPSAAAASTPAPGSTTPAADPPASGSTTPPAGTPPAGTPPADPPAAPPASSVAAGGPPAGAPPAPKVPDKYTLTVPDAVRPMVDPEELASFEQMARAGGLTNDEAQAALDEQLALVQAKSARFLEKTKADPVYGGDKLTETQKLSQRVIDKIRPAGHARRDAFLAVLNSGGYGNHIEVVSFLADLGRLMGEDSPGLGASAPGGQTDAAAGLYNHPSSIALQEQVTRANSAT